ncbi:MAG: hypothetical protein ABJL99_17855 [Aliishimia sp.]
MNLPSFRFAGLSARLSKYLSPQLFEDILTGRQTDAIVSQRKKLTVFFVDTVGFTEITDSLEREELAAPLEPIERKRGSGGRAIHRTEPRLTLKLALSDLLQEECARYAGALQDALDGPRQ